MNMAGLTGARWRKSSVCAENTCGEVAIGDGVIGVRNSTDPDTVVVFTPDEWNTLLTGARLGEFNYPAV
jgi:hypothetical protein